ncbi:MAG: DUF2062 domain-containing protein [Nannocystis sp.]|nr:DUF2062 domain-containing protein [Nannocystis sp.]MBA3550132.1 DUF2062 domain-containing protein [Nannocystis sp.]
MGRLRAWLRGLLELNGTPRGIAGGFALGVGLSLIPVPFLGMVLALAAAPLVRANVAATYLGTAVINPVTGPLFYFAELWLGTLALGLPLPSWSTLTGLDAAGWWALFKALLGPFLLGAAVLIPTLSALSYVVVLMLVRMWRRRRASPILTAPTDAAAASVAPASDPRP